MSMLAFTPGLSGTIAVTATSARLNLSATAGPKLYVYNAGSSECFIAFGDSTVTAVAGGNTTAATGSMSVPAGAFFVIEIGLNATYVAAVCASGNTTTLRLTRGDGC